MELNWLLRSKKKNYNSIPLWDGIPKTDGGTCCFRQPSLGLQVTLISLSLLAWLRPSEVDVRNVISIQVYVGINIEHNLFNMISRLYDDVIEW